MVTTRTYHENSSSESLFEREETVSELMKLGNPLALLNEIVDFNVFRPTLEEALVNRNRKNNAGRKPLDPVFVFKVLVLQRLYGLSDEQTEYQIVDRLSFRSFLGIRTFSDVPDARTLWKYRDILATKRTFDTLFDDFNKVLESKGLIVNEGKIIDASFVEVPRQRNTREENQKIKDGEGDELWDDNPHKKSHKDVDARWTKKRNENHYGYKNHAKVCRKTKLIRSYDTTDASVHDSKVSDSLIDDRDAKGEDVWLDAGYVGKDDDLKKKEVNPIICERGYRNHPLSEEQKESNREKSRIRVRVEHAFGFIEGSMGGMIFRGVGMVRAKANVALTNLTYNIARFAQIFRYHPQWMTVSE